MKKKINIQLLGIAALAITLTLLLIVGLFYKLFQQQVFEDLNTSAYLLKSTSSSFLQSSNEFKDKLRITIIDKDGTVSYDNTVDFHTMDNHKNRPEVREALLNGEGQAIRKSDTVKKSTFYYAVLLENGSVLRIAKDASNIWDVFAMAFPIIIGIAVLLFVICMILAHFLTKNLVAPIEQMANNLDNLGEIDTYCELIPFINMINKQHEDILKSAMMRQEFTANVSHELKTPLTSISGYAELIENGMATDKDIIRFAQEIHQNASRLLTLINDIIKLSELDETNIEIPFEPVNVYNIARTCVDMLQLNAENHQVRLTFWGEPCFILATKEMLEEVVYNLCDNAIRYNTTDGLVHVSVKPIGDEVFLTVKDTGIGISQKDQKRIFERFYRVDKSRSKSTGGTGLGLAIVKHILFQLQAKMNLKSEIGKGTEIEIVFSKINQ